MKSRKKVKPYLVEYMFGKINRVFEWFDDKDELDCFVDWLTDTRGEELFANKLTYCKKYEVKEIKER